MRPVPPKRLRIGIASVAVLASLSCFAIPLAQERSTASAQGQGGVGARPNQEDQSFSAILSFAEKAVASLQIADSGRAGVPYAHDLYTCGQVTNEFLPDDDPYSNVTDLAIWISLFSPDFKKEGTYDVAAPYIKQLMDYGEAETQRANLFVKSEFAKSHKPYPLYLKAVLKLGNWEEDNEPLLQRLAKALNKAVHRKEYVVEGGCGAGEIFVSVKIPTGSAALLINTFHFTLCQARGMDAWNAQVCYGWKTVGKVPMLLSGAYRYVLTAADGQKKVGDVLVNTKNGGSEDQPYVLNLK